MSSIADTLTSLGGSGTEASNGWNKMTSLHRSQQSVSTLESSQITSAESVVSGPGSSTSDANSMAPRSAYRHSLDLKQQQGLDLGYFRDSVPEAPNVMKSPATSQGMAAPKLQPSFSANDIPTVKNAGNQMSMSNANAHAQQHFHNHNASIGRIPPGAVPKRHSRDLSNDGHAGLPQSATFPSIGSALHANAPAFGPTVSAPQTSAQSTPAVSSPSSSMSGYPSYYSGSNGYNPSSPNGNNYNMGMLMHGMNNMNLGGYTSQNYTTGYGPMYQPSQPRDSQQRVIQQRRAQDNESKTTSVFSYGLLVRD